jgi:hypothetical protein
VQLNWDDEAACFVDVEDDRTSDQDPREPPLGRSWSPRDGSHRPAPRSYHEPADRDDPDEPDEYGIPRSL